jgi:hypothetical protein
MFIQLASGKSYSNIEYEKLVFDRMMMEALKNFYSANKKKVTIIILRFNFSGNFGKGMKTHR